MIALVRNDEGELVEVPLEHADPTSVVGVVLREPEHSSWPLPLDEEWSVFL